MVVDSPWSRGQSELANMSCVGGGKLSHIKLRVLSNEESHMTAT